MFRLSMLAAVLIAGTTLAGCHASPPPAYDSGELEVRGATSGTWSGGDASLVPNVVIEYATVASRAGREFHRMTTVLSLSYDPEKGVIENARIDSSDAGRAYRHVCLAPTGAVLHVRMATLFDGRAEDLTVVKLHDDRPMMDVCEEVGVGPQDGLVESFDVLFRRDGTYRVLQDTKAYLAGASLQVTRTITDGSGGRISATYP